MALFTTFITTPTVMAIYKPARGVSSRTFRCLQSVSKSIKDELRILACVYGPGTFSSVINLVESTRSTNKSRLKLYIMHLVELTERSSSILMAQRLRKNGFPFTNRLRCREIRDRVGVAFQAYGQLGRVSVIPSTAISPLLTMHEDICHVAEDKRVTMIILPFHKQWRTEEEGGAVENMGHGWRGVTQRVLANPPCSVALLVDRGIGGGSKQSPGPTATVAQRVCVLFFGGADDREALMLGARMAEHPAVKLTVVRFVEKGVVGGHGITLRPSPSNCREKSYSFSTAAMNREQEKEQTNQELDEGAMSEFQRRWDGMVEYVERVASNIMEGVLALGRSRDHDLIVVGKGRFPWRMVAELAERQAEHAELGPIGDLLASTCQGMVSSVLVIQQHDVAHAEVPVSKIVHTEADTSETQSPPPQGLV